MKIATEQNGDVRFLGFVQSVLQMSKEFKLSTVDYSKAYKLAGTRFGSRIEDIFLVLKETQNPAIQKPSVGALVSVPAAKRVRDEEEQMETESLSKRKTGKGRGGRDLPPDGRGRGRGRGGRQSTRGKVAVSAAGGFDV